MSTVALQAKRRVIQTLSTEVETQRKKTKQQLLKLRQGQCALCDLRKQLQQVSQVPPQPPSVSGQHSHHYRSVSMNLLSRLHRKGKGGDFRVDE